MTADDSEDYSADAKADGTEDQSKARKRKERLEQNRISARESRKRKKTMIEELQRTVITLSRENKDLNERNEQLRRQLMEIGAKVSAQENLCVRNVVVCCVQTVSGRWPCGNDPKARLGDVLMVPW